MPANPSPAPDEIERKVAKVWQAVAAEKLRRGSVGVEVERDVLERALRAALVAEGEARKDCEIAQRQRDGNRAQLAIEARRCGQAELDLLDVRKKLAAATREAEALRDAGNQMNGLLVRLGMDSHMDVALALDAWKLALLAPRSPEGEGR